MRSREGDAAATLQNYKKENMSDEKTICPCAGWAQVNVKSQDREPRLYNCERHGLRYVTEHHPNCEHVDDSLVDMIEVRSSLGRGALICDDVAEAKDVLGVESEEEWLRDYTFTPIRIHSEALDQMPEFDGF